MVKEKRWNAIDKTLMERLSKTYLDDGMVWHNGRIFQLEPGSMTCFPQLTQLLNIFLKREKVWKVCFFHIYLLVP